MGVTAILSSKGQLVIPKSVRNEVGLHAGSKMVVEVNKENIIQLYPMKKSISRLFGMGKHRTKGRIMSIEEMDKAIEQAIMERHEMHDRR